MKAPRPTFFEFCRHLQGFNYFSKKSGSQVYRFQLYGTGLTAEEIKEKYNVVLKDKYNE
jgi:methylglyoxal synthase